MPATLLPPNATPLEGHLEQAMAMYEDGRDVPIDALWDPHRCPAALLPWLAWALGVRRWDAAWTEDVKRAVIAGAVPLRRIEGTRGAIAAHLDAIGAVYSIVERPGQAWFRAQILIYNSAEVGAAATAALQAQIDDVTRLSVEWGVSLRVAADVTVPVAAGADVVTVVDVRVPVDGPLFPGGTPEVLLAGKSTPTRFLLPAALGGVEPLRYALTPALPGALARTGLVVTGTPAEVAPVATYTWTVTDARGIAAVMEVPIGVAFEAWCNSSGGSAMTASAGAVRLTWIRPKPWYPVSWMGEGARDTTLDYLEVTSTGQVTLSVGPRDATNPLAAGLLTRLRFSLTLVNTASGTFESPVIFGGPADPTAQTPDTTEPYVWTPAATEVTELQGFVAAVNAATLASANVKMQIWEVPA